LTEKVLRTVAFAALAAALTVQFLTAVPDREDAIANDPALSGTIDAQNVALEVQLHLKGLGFDPGPIDGIPGSRTRSAIRAYRTWMGVPGDDTVTRDLLVTFGEGG
jgi:peptidoglycan hydrolase-like protein with peptidoglycan-binding domain